MGWRCWRGRSCWRTTPRARSSPPSCPGCPGRWTFGNNTLNGNSPREFTYFLSMQCCPCLKIVGCIKKWPKLRFLSFVGRGGEKLIENTQMNQEQFLLLCRKQLSTFSAWLKFVYLGIFWAVIYTHSYFCDIRNSYLERFQTPLMVETISSRGNSFSVEFSKIAPLKWKMYMMNDLNNRWLLLILLLKKRQS